MFFKARQYLNPLFASLLLFKLQLCAVINQGRVYPDSAVIKFVFFVDEGKMLTVMRVNPPLHTPPPPPCSFTPLQMCTDTHGGWGHLWLNLCVCMYVALFPLPSWAPGQPPPIPNTQTHKQQRRLCIHWTAGWDGRGGWGGDWVLCLEKKKGGRKRRGEGEGRVLRKQGWADGGGKEVQGGGEGRTAGWLAPWLGCVWAEKGCSWADSSSGSANNLRRLQTNL